MTAATAIFSGTGPSVLLSAVLEVTAGAGVITSLGYLRTLALNVRTWLGYILLILGRTCLRDGCDSISYWYRCACCCLWCQISRSWASRSRAGHWGGHCGFLAVRHEMCLVSIQVKS